MSKFDWAKVTVPSGSEGADNGGKKKLGRRNYRAQGAEHGADPDHRIDLRRILLAGAKVGLCRRDQSWSC